MEFKDLKALSIKESSAAPELDIVFVVAIYSDYEDCE